MTNAHMTLDVFVGIQDLILGLWDSSKLKYIVHMMVARGVC